MARTQTIHATSLGYSTISVSNLKKENTTSESAPIIIFLLAKICKKIYNTYEKNDFESQMVMAGMHIFNRLSIVLILHFLQTSIIPL